MRYLYIVITLYLPQLCYSQENYSLTSYRTEDGLPQSKVSAITQDIDGFMWLGTDDGLCRYDGYSFKIYKNNVADARSIAGNFKYALYLDNDHTLWVASNNGVSKYDRHTDNFTTVFRYDPGNINVHNGFYGDDAQYLWVGMCGYGLLKINKHTNKVQREPLPAETPRPEYAWHKGFIKQHTAWVCCNDSVYLFDLQTKKVKKVELPISDIAAINDSIAVGTSSVAAYVINIGTLQHTTIFFKNDRSRGNIAHISRLSDTMALLSSPTSGLYFLNITIPAITANLTKINADRQDELLFACYSYTDRSGNLWIGTVEDGAKKITYSTKKIKFYHSQTGHLGVRSVYADNSNLYIGYYQHGFDVFSRKTGFTRNVMLSSSFPSLADQVATIAKYDENHLFIAAQANATDNNSIPVCYVINSGKLLMKNTDVHNSVENTSAMRSYRPFFYNKPDGTLLCNIENKLVVLNKYPFSNFKPEVLHTFAGEQLSCCYATAGKLYVGTFNGIYSCINGHWAKIKLRQKVDVKTICCGPSGDIWMGCNDGIYITNDSGNKLLHFTEKNGLKNEHVYGILCDDDGNMWFSHNRGITEYNAKEQQFYHFSKFEGLQSSEFNSNAYFKAPDGELFFGGVNGVNSFYPSEIKASNNSFEVKIIGISLSDKPYVPDSTPWTTPAITYSYIHSNITFDFALPDFNNPSQNHYQYTMEGVDHNWVNSGTVHQARYTGMKPGNYVFKVRAANSDGNWGKAAAIRITIIPPFWDTWWFILLETTGLLLAAITITVATYTYVSRKKIRVLHDAQRIQNERERISRDLHDNVGTQLSLINKSLKSIVQPTYQLTEADKTQKLFFIEKYSSEIIETLRETIWAMNKKEITLQELADKLKVYIQKLTELNPGLVTEFEEIDNSVATIITPTETLHLFRICQEVLTNVIKHANATSIHIAFSSSTNKYCISISDNGSGFDTTQETAGKHYGLENLKYRAGEISCSLTIQSNKNNGTTVTICKI